MKLHMRMRKFIGMILMLVFLLFYALVVMVIATSQHVPQAGFGAFIFYFICGLAWTPPVAGLIWWMQRPS